MVIDRAKILDDLQRLCRLLDSSKADFTLKVSEIDLVLRADVSAASLCSFYISVSPYDFDLTLENKFSVSDVRHVDFDYNSVLKSIVAGHVSYRSGGGLLGLRACLVVAADDRDLYTVGPIDLVSNWRRKLSYGSYLLK